jgi:hypothetical protein
MGAHEAEIMKGWDKATMGMQRQSHEGTKVEPRQVGEDMATRVQRCEDSAATGIKIGRGQ